MQLSFAIPNAVVLTYIFRSGNRIIKNTVMTHQKQKHLLPGQENDRNRYFYGFYLTFYSKCALICMLWSSL